MAAAAAIVFGGLLAASPAAAAVTCNPSINPPGTPAPGTVVAPGLRVISTQWGLGNCPTAFFASARTPDGTIWLTDYANNLWKSTDDLRTLQKTYTATGYAQIEQVLPLSSGTILIVVRDSSGNRHVLRSTDSTGTSFDSTPVLNLPPGAQLHDSNSWAQVNGAVYIGQYQGGPPVDLWKSTNDGQTFSVVWQGSNSDEIHAVQADPYQPGRIWMMLDGAEDGLSGTQVGYSDNGGATWTWVTDGSYPESRVVDLMFDSDAVYWGTDSGDVPAGLFRYDRATGHVTQVMTNLNGPFLDAVSYNGQFAQFSGVEPNSDGYIGDQNIHVLTNGDGTSWSETTTPWSRDQGNTADFATTEGNTQPDSQGRFWLAYFDLAGSPNGEANIEFQFDPTADYSGPSSSFTASPNPFIVGQPVSFDGSASLSPAMPISFLWNFGDGSTASGSATASHRYLSTGPYTASLQVNDADNNAALSTLTLAATPQPPTAATGAAPATSTGATLYGDATPNGSAASAYFEYGTSTSYGSQTAPESVGSGSSPQSATATLSNLQPNTTYHYRLDAISLLGRTDGIDRVFTTPPSPTSALTGSASNIAALSATLNGSVSPGGLETTYYFNYGTTSAYGNSTPFQDAGDGSSTEALSASATGLQGNTTYHFQTVAVNESGTFYGPDQTFTTLPPPPAASTSPATFVSAAGAQLNGTVNPYGYPTSVSFEYGTTSSYGSQTPSQDAGSGNSSSPVTLAISGLQPYTTYHYRLDAVNANGTTFGPDQTFTTTAGAPVVTTGAAGSITSSTATLNGSVDPQGQTSTAYFQYGTSASYGSQTTSQTLPGNLVPNPGCADGTTSGWRSGGTAAATFQSQTGWASVGPASCRFTTAALPSGGYSEADGGPATQNFTAGTQLNASVDLNVLSVNAGQHIVLYVTWLNSSGGGLSKDQAASTSSPGVQTLSGTLTAPASATSALLDVTVEGAGTTDMYFDNAQLVAAGSGTLQNISAQLANLQPNTTYHYRTVATSDTGTSYGPDQTLTTSGAAPAASTSPATFVSAAGAQLNGTVNPYGYPTSVSFEYGTTSSYGSQTPSQDAGSGNSSSPVTLAISGLQPYTTYHYRLDAVNANGTTFGPDQTFTTTAGAPVVTTGAAGSITSSTATLNGSVDPQGQTSTAYFQYGTSASYGSQTTSQTLPGNLVPNPGCADGTTSGWRSGGTAAATFQSQTGWASVGPASCRFTTAALPSGGYSEADGGPATQNFTAGTQLNASVDLNVLSVNAGQHIVLYVTWLNSSGGGLSKDQAASTSSPGVQTLSGTLTAPASATSALLDVTVEGAGTTDMYFDNAQLVAAGSGTLQNISAQLANLQPNTTYHYRTVATSDTGTSYGPDQTLTTSGAADTTPPSSTATSPASSTTSSWNVSFTASDNPGGTGVAEIDLYAQAPGQSGYTKVASNTTGAGSGSFSYTATAGNGNYNFYTLATDNAGNVQATPTSPQTTTSLNLPVPDTTPPSSTATSPASSTTSSWNVSFTASDNPGGTGVAEIDLYAQAPGQSGYTKVASNTTGAGSGSFSYTATAGNGNYNFYTLATDNAGNVQATPTSPQTTTSLNLPVPDTTPPSSTATSPASSTTSSWNVSFTASDNPGGTGVAEIDLYAQAPGQSGYTKVASNTTGAGSGSFSYTATAGNGNYNFYTLATDNAGNVQATPTSPQTTTSLNLPVPDTTPPSSTATSPASSTTSSWNVSFTASDNPGGTGVAEIDLYAQAPGQSGYTKVASNTTGAGSGSFSYTATAGNGNYNFYTLATDNAGNVQATPTSPQTTTSLNLPVPDTTPPSSTATSPASSTTSSWNVSFTASDNPGGTGVAEIDLYAQAPGQSGYTKVASNTTGAGSGSFSYTATAGNGNYNFYTLATDNAGNVQATPTSPQTTTTLKRATSTTVAAPATDAKGNAIVASSITSTLSGATVGATGTITFKVFGPRTTPPSTCTSGGTAVGSPVSVSGGSTYPASAGITPSTAGTYWWYASYSGDSANPASNSGCGGAITSTVVKNTTIDTASAPTAGTVGTAIAPSSISSKLSGSTSGATGTITFTVFGPQASPPSACTVGGTQVGSPVSVSGSSTYHPTASITPGATGDYWWYASYSGDATNSPASSSCGTAMAETVVYRETSAASATDISLDSSTTTSSFNVQPNTTYLLLVARHSQSGDTITSIASTGLTPALSTSSFMSISSQSYSTVDHQWAYDVTSAGGANGTGTLTVSFSKTSGSGGSTIIDLVALAGNSTVAPIATANTAAAHSSGNVATAKLPTVPGSLDAEFVFLSAQQDLGTAPSSTPAMTSAFYSDQAAGSAGVFAAVPAQRSESLALSNPVNWGTLAFEIQHG